MSIGAYGAWTANWGIIVTSLAGTAICIRRYVANVRFVRMIVSEDYFDTEKFRQLSGETIRGNAPAIDGGE